MPHIEDGLDPELSKHLKTIVKYFEKEDRAVRERQVRHYRRLKLYWNNLSMVYWDDSAKDYRTAGQGSDTYDDGDQAYYDKPVNVFKAFLETIIAALSIQIPSVVCVPDDADNPDDLSTAKAGDKVSERIYKHNNVIFLWLYSLYIYCTEGMISCYTYPREDKSYGTYQKPEYKEEDGEAYICPECGGQIDDDVFEGDSDSIPDETLGLPDMDGESLVLSDTVNCPECGSEISRDLPKTKVKVSKFVGNKEYNKTRLCMEVYGGLYIKIANYAKKQADTPYLNFAYETHYANVLERYPNLKEKMPKGTNPGTSLTGVYDPYELTARQNPQYLGETPEDNVTVTNSWLRPAAYNILDEEGEELVRKKFPDGVKVVMVNDLCADYEADKLDDRWTLTRNPMSDFLTHEPLGELLTNIQDITNDLISLTLQTIEHGITQVFADPAVVDFKGQSQLESTPGMYTPAKPQSSNKNISDGFFATNAATLSPEVFSFYRIVQELGQFVSGALPSLFGGSPSPGSSKTASEYAMSKSMAMQRLNTPWKMMTIWWKEIFTKAIPQYMAEMAVDERVVEKGKQGGFVNSFIRKADMTGKIGEITLDVSDTVPVSDEQKAELIIRLMELNNMEIMQALITPDNLPSIRKIVKIPEFKLPGEDDRQKQYEEINELVNSEPIVMPPGEEEIIMALASGQEPQEIELPSVEVDPDVDNHEIEASICRSWLISETGRLARMENPAGYKNVLLHMKAHMQILAQNMMAQQQQAIEEENQSQPAKGKKTDQQVKGESDAKLPIQ